MGPRSQGQCGKAEGLRGIGTWWLASMDKKTLRVVAGFGEERKMEEQEMTVPNACSQVEALRARCMAFHFFLFLFL